MVKNPRKQNCIDFFFKSPSPTPLVTHFPTLEVFICENEKWFENQGIVDPVPGLPLTL